LTQEAADEAVQAALRLLRHRDRSGAQLDRALGSRGFSEGTRATALATLERTGLVDDDGFAQRRAAALAERGAGNALIRHDLGRAGLADEVVEAAVAALEDELTRAGRIVERRGASQKTSRYLAGKGFSDDVVREIVARAGDEAIG
jgi:SOS response regulatory protein OraA/RecX